MANTGNTRDGPAGLPDSSNRWLARRDAPTQDGAVERPLIEGDGSVHWLPVGAERLAALRVRRRQPDGTWLTTVHCHPAEVYRAGDRFFVRRPKRAGTGWHTIELDAAQLHAQIQQHGGEATLSID